MGAPPTRMDEAQLTAEGYYSTFGVTGARTEMPGCSLCMGNQARVGEKTTCVSTSTRNFPNRLGKGANVYLSSAEIATVSAILGKIPTFEEYLPYAEKLAEPSISKDTYRYLNFNELDNYMADADSVKLDESAYDSIGASAKAEIMKLKKEGKMLA